MTRTEITANLNEVFCDVFEDQNIVIHEETTAQDIPKWDSVSHIDMICMVEEKFRIRLTTKEVAGLKNVGELISVLEKKAGA